MTEVVGKLFAENGVLVVDNLTTKRKFSDVKSFLKEADVCAFSEFQGDEDNTVALKGASDDVQVSISRNEDGKITEVTLKFV